MPLTTSGTASDAALRRVRLYVRLRKRLQWWRTDGRESHLTTALWVLLALSIGVCIGYMLCSVMMVASDEQQRADHGGLRGAPPLEPDSR
jgi:hypothetical protein